MAYMGLNNKGTSVFLWAWAFLHGVYGMVMFWFFFLGAVDETGNDGALDPTVIKWLLMGGSIFCFLLFLLALWAGTFSTRLKKWRQNAHTWFYGVAVFFLVVHTVWAWLWDSRHASLFAGGSPVIPPLADLDPLFGTKLRAYLQWQTIETGSYLLTMIILFAAVMMWATVIIHEQQSATNSRDGTIPTRAQLGQYGQGRPVTAKGGARNTRPAGRPVYTTPPM